VISAFRRNKNLKDILVHTDLNKKETGREALRVSGIGFIRLPVTTLPRYSWVPGLEGLPGGRSYRERIKGSTMGRLSLYHTAPASACASVRVVLLQ